MTLQILLAFVIASLAVIITPGPTTLYLLSLGATKGKKYAMAFIIGLTCGLILHILLFTFGFSQFIYSSKNIFTAVKIFGACYLFWLAYKVYKCSESINLDENSSEESGSKTLFGIVGQGFLMNFINPQVMMFFLAFFPKFIQNDSDGQVSQALKLGGVFILQSVFFFILVGILASQLTNVLRNNLWIDTFFKWMQIVVFIGIGIYILWE